MARSAELRVLAQIGPWPAADRLIAYRGRLWFSTSVKGVNHNSADLWSIDPASGDTRYERYLFSQDAGIAAVHGGLLFWPHEDMRMGGGYGVISVTDGKNWRNLYLPSASRMLHTHAVSEWNGKLVVAMAGWNSALATSSDLGRTWKTLIDDEPREGGFHRYNGLGVLGDRLVVRHWERSGVSVSEFRDGKMRKTPGWPKGVDVSELVVFQHALYAIVRTQDDVTELWHIAGDDYRANKISISPRGLDLRAITSDGQSLWLAVRTPDGGQLWSSRDGVEFMLAHSFGGGTPVSITSLGENQIYVGGKSDDGQAIVWGPREPATAASQTFARAGLPAVPSCSHSELGGRRLHQDLHDELQGIDNYQRHGSGLLEAIGNLVSKRPPPGFFARFLEVELPEQPIEVFGGQFSVPAREIGLWHLINAMEANCEASVPVRLLEPPWSRKSNGPQKWFDPLLVAMRVIQQLRQNDRSTIDALVTRLDRSNDPDWLQSQIVGTLTAITGQRFAYDFDEWHNWWRGARGEWPDQAFAE